MIGLIIFAYACIAFKLKNTYRVIFISVTVVGFLALYIGAAHNFDSNYFDYFNRVNKVMEKMPGVKIKYSSRHQEIMEPLNNFLFFLLVDGKKYQLGFDRSMREYNEQELKEYIRQELKNPRNIITPREYCKKCKGSH